MVKIELKNLTKVFSNEVIIDALDLTINSGEVMALLGPSGCGKTTTLKIISGLLDPDKGDLLFDGQSVLDITTENREAVLVFQDYLLFPHLTVAENIAFGLKMRGVSEKIKQKRVKELLNLVNLTGYDECYPHELSGGQQQRISLARSLAINPQVLLLDEPLTNLDANLRGEMQKLIKDIHIQEKMTTIFVTHDRDEAMLMADRIAVMNEGQIEQCGSSEELYNHPKTRFVADFFGKANYLSGVIEENSFKFEGGELLINQELLNANKIFQSQKETKVMIRPEFIHLSSVGANDSQLIGVIKNRSFAGERIFYNVDIGSQILQVTTLPPSQFKVGEEVEIRIDQQNIWFME